MRSLFSIQTWGRAVHCVYGVSALALLLAFGNGAVLARASTELPIATTVELSGAPSDPGMVVRYTESTNRYSLTSEPFDAAVYGVIGERPAIVFVTASNTIPVVTEGVSSVLVDAGLNGALARGDLLTTSAKAGVAMRASTSTTEVFAIALEDLRVGQGMVMAEVGVERAKALQQERAALLTASIETEEKDSTSYVRLVFAALLTVGALLFLLVSFRSILNSGVLSIGRNPRARRSVVLLSIGSMTMVLVLAAVIVLVAIGVLVLPV